MTEIQKAKCRRIYEHYGVKAQREQLVEECAELIKAACKFTRAAKDYGTKAYSEAQREFISEAADVAIMLEQHILCCFGEKEIDDYIDYKLQRQLKRIEAEK